MKEINAVWQYLSRFPLWQDGTSAVDTVPAVPDGCGLFPQGMEVLQHRQDVTGGQKLRLRQTFLLRRRAVHTCQSASWLLRLQGWVAENPPCELEPVFGSGLTLHMEKGRMTQKQQTGTALYEGTIIIEYTKEKYSDED